MQRILVTLLFLLFSLACRPMTPDPVNATGSVSAGADSIHGLQLEIGTASGSSPGGVRMPLRFTIHNLGERPLHACLSGGRVIHLWELDRDYGYTLAEHRADEPSCDEPFDLPGFGAYSWTEEVTLPPAPGAARLVGLTQIVPAEPCTGACGPFWLTASAPFEIRKEAEGQGGMLDLRTGLQSTELVAPLAASPGPRP